MPATEMPRTLLDLPAEIVQHVLFMLDPPTFYVCLLTNKGLREHALQSRKVLLHQIAQVPGDRNIIPRDRKDTQPLLSIFNKRAARHLFSGVPRMADINLWKACPSMNRSISNIFPWYDDYPCRCCAARLGVDLFVALSKPSDKYMFVEVPAKNAVLQVHYLEGNWSGDGPFRWSHVISQDFLWGHLSATSDTLDTEGRKVLRTAWQGGCPICLEEHTPTLAVLSGQSHLTNLELVIIKIHPHFGPSIQARYSIEAPPEAEAVAALAFTSEGKPTITWQWRFGCYVFILYDSIETPDGSHHLTWSDKAVLGSDLTGTERITHVQVRSGKAIFLTRTFQMPLCSGGTNAATWAHTMFSKEVTSLPAGVAGVTTSRRGIYLTQRHLHRHWNPIVHQHYACANAVLKLFLSRDEYHIHPDGPALQGAYIVRTLHASDDACNPFDPLVTNNTLYHRYVARLADTPCLHNLPSIGLKVFLSPDHGLYGPRPSDDGNAFTYCDIYPTAAWRSGYYNNWTREDEHVLLEPVAVPSTGVIHALRWVSEDELWAVTDEGVCRWNLGVRATGKRTEESLAHCGGDLGIRRAKVGRDGL
ncbi:hypothetical protein PMIN01_03044 [Paraphaeosphaeria minitans]|uniref:F-box domain-containing protein n=1 Tax=Paraphaeosphaeria minitans TaxID=565426 RepID=A0A9P6KW01_9PLEO|nr:hypothetical protein PMIN01_03044 [Paraphaeosphaeria minitans]